MKVYRIDREKYLSTALSGAGAAKSEGFRWNSIGTSLVYTAESRALAVLEVAVHLDLNEDLPQDRWILEIDVPDDIQILEIDVDDLPENWNAKPPITITQYVGDEFVNQNIAAVLKVPSAIIPEESNYVINPLHPDAIKIKVISKKQLQFDSRLKK